MCQSTNCYLLIDTCDISEYKVKAALSDKYETGGFVLMLIFWSKHRKAVIGYLCWKQANSSKRVNLGKHQVWPNYPN